MQTILITGPRGLLGATLLRVLAEKGYTPVGFDGDIRDKELLMQKVKESGATWVVHTAAKTDVGACEREPEEARAINAEGTANVVEAARAQNIPVIYISTASVFSGMEGNYKEGDIPKPSNVYNKTKVEGEEYVAAYAKGMILRLNLIGIHPNGSRGKNFIEWLNDSVKANKDLTLFDDQFINPLSNWTIANLIAEIIKKNLDEKFLHIGSSDVLSKADIGKLIVKRFPHYSGTVTAKSIDTIADGVVRPKQMWLNTDLGTALLGVMPSVEDEIESIYQAID